MDSQNSVLRDIERNPTAWVIECPKCGSLVNAKYMLALGPMLGVAILPHFYCHCSRFQVMNPRPAKLASSQTVIILYSFMVTVLTKMINYILRGGKFWSRA